MRLVMEVAILSGWHQPPRWYPRCGSRPSRSCPSASPQGTWAAAFCCVFPPHHPPLSQDPGAEAWDKGKARLMPPPSPAFSHPLTEWGQGSHACCSANRLNLLPSSGVP